LRDLHGTGKTQTILNIISNIIIKGKSVAVVSNNNAATDNVYEKLEKYGLSYLCARLGKKDNKDEFINNQTGKYPQFEIVTGDTQNIEKEIMLLNQNVNRIFKIQNKMAKMKQELSEIRLEHEYFNKYEGKKIDDRIKIRNIKKLKSKTIMRLKVECEELKSINYIFKIKSNFIYGIGNKNLYKKRRKDYGKMGMQRMWLCS